jgi:hypothetical protein
MITKTYICDVCKKSVGESELYGVSVSITVPKKPDTYSQKLLTINKDICEECLKNKGIVVDIPEDKKNKISESNKKTLESKLIDILEDLGVAFQE